ncbi:hypothetical protein P3L40_04595 [Providencia sp. PROV040]|nr:hypothetical protein [Providencia sp. PROV040]WOB87178.1 hypothetical protein P3L40_04595 [Providencia sp. PROV040]
MMTGVIEPVSVIFPEGASQGVEVLYQDFSFGRYFNQIAAAVLKGLLSHYQPTGLSLCELLKSVVAREEPPLGCYLFYQHTTC